MNKKKFTTKNIVLIAIFSVLIIICSWISIPSTIPFTLQTFAIFLTIYLLGSRDALISIIVYLLLGIIGLPVFSGIKGGIAVLLGPTGGYLIGFIFTALFMWLWEVVFNNKLISKIIASVIGLAICYIFGSLWFYFVYMNNGNEISFISVLSMCVAPFVAIDLIKIALALLLENRLTKIIFKEEKQA